MEYTIITRKQSDNNGGIKSLNIGYTTDTTLITQINDNYDSTLGLFITENIEGLQNGTTNIGDFFSGTSRVHEARHIIDSFGDMVLPEITDINQL